MIVTENIKKEYLDQDYRNPKYIFHGSKNLFEKLMINKAHDSKDNEKNMQMGVYASSIFKGAVPYAIKGKGKYDCQIGYYPNNLKMKIFEGVIPENDYGYIYVCEAKHFEQCDNSCQYVSYRTIRPIEIIKIYYKDFKDCFEYVKKEN